MSGIEKIELNMEDEIYPWELEYLTELCLFLNDDNHKPIKASEMAEIVTIIRNYKHPYFRKKDKALEEE